MTNDCLSAIFSGVMKLTVPCVSSKQEDHKKKSAEPYQQRLQPVLPHNCGEYRLGEGDWAALRPLVRLISVISVYSSRPSVGGE